MRGKAAAPQVSTSAEAYGARYLCASAIEVSQRSLLD